MKSSVVFSLALAASLFAGKVFAQEAASPSVMVYTHSLLPAPDAGQPTVAKMTSRDPQGEKAKPASDAAKAAAGWMMMEYSGNITGYAPRSTGRKDLSILPGTTIRAAANDSSAALGTAAASPATMIVLIEGDWAQVSYPGPATLYFLAPQAPKPAPQAVAAPAPAPAPVEVTPAPAPAPVVVAAAPVVAAPVAATAVADPTTAPTPRYYYGVLKQRTDPKISGPTSAQYTLTSVNGQLLALLDLSKVSLAKPITEYLNKPVKIYGTPQPTPSFPNVMVNVQLLQLN